MHSGINYVTPKVRHEGKDNALLEKRVKLYKACESMNPTHWSKSTRKWNYIDKIALNPLNKTECTEEGA